GAGAYFGMDSDLNTSVRIQGTPARSRAVLFAALLAIRAVDPYTPLRVYTTDDYLARVVCHWAGQNARKEWHVPYGALLRALARTITARSAPVSFEPRPHTARLTAHHLAADMLAYMGS
ncbi:hypothetical protein C8T65DRAFT_536660, partial [Cerioporus squamosus]